jgi:RHS repeat-associated protein
VNPCQHPSSLPFVAPAPSSEHNHARYDAENRLIQVDAGNTAVYTYDGEGHRASKDDTGSVNSGWNTPDPSGTTEFVYDPQGHLVHTESPNGGGGWRGEVFAGNRHLATYNGNLVFNHADWLGTARNRDIPDPNAPQYPSNQNITSLPFGDWLDNTQGIVNDWTPLDFTGQYHDFETDLDYFRARYFGSSMGRFMTPDWSAKPQGVPYAVLDDPQSLNLYTYVRNNPLNRTDPDGHYELNASGCGDNTKCQKKWDKAADKFESRREKDLKSKKADVRAAAANFGALGEANGVHVGFADLSSRQINGSVDASGSVGGHAAYPGDDRLWESGKR